MVLSIVQELLPKYDKVRSNSTGGAYDNYVMQKFHLSKLLNFKPFKLFYYRTYAMPFARERFLKEIRLDLIEYLNHFRKLQLKGNNDYKITKSIESISSYLDNLPKLKQRDSKIKQFLPFLGGLITPGLLYSAITAIPQYYPLIALVGLMTTVFLVPFAVDKLIKYLTEKHWYDISQKEHGISKLKLQLVEELVRMDKSS